jgi:hypothetical protein
MSFSQRQNYHRASQFDSSYLPIMNNIATFLSSKVTIIDRNKSNYRELGYLIKTDKIESKIILFNYLDIFPLFSYKYFTVSIHNKLHQLVISKDYKKVNGNDQLSQLKLLMSYKSSAFSWDHLNKFYKN